MNSNFNVVKNSICSVVSELGSGTGWLYRRGNNTNIDKQVFVITAAHMVIERDESNNETIYNPTILVQNVNGSNNNQIFNTKVISIDRKGDFALLEILNHRGFNNKFPQNWPSHTTLKISTTKPDIGSSIYIVGYPEGFDYNSFAGGYLRENNASEYFTPTSLYYNLATSPGNSGSPVMNTSNQVIGMLQWGYDGEELDGGIRGDYLYYVIEKMINSYVNSNRTLTNDIYVKQAIDIFNDGLSSFVPLNSEVIKLFQQYDIGGFGYNNGNRPINGVLLLDDDYLTTLVIEKIKYTNFSNTVKTITISSSIFDKTSIWEVNYFAKRNSIVELTIYDLEVDETFTISLTLKDMPKSYDYFLTNGFKNKNKLKIKENFNDSNLKEIIKLSKTKLIK
jgi:V8-like Glu-specific endopeptidase